MTLLSDWGMSSIMAEMTLDVNRAFSAGALGFTKSWGDAPG